MALIPKNTTFSPTITGKKLFNPLTIDCPPTDNVTTAQYAFVGDFPTSIEVLEGEPFAGPSGSQFNRITAAANIPRYTCYLTTACKAMPPKKNFNAGWEVTYKSVLRSGDVVRRWTVDRERVE